MILTRASACLASLAFGLVIGCSSSQAAGAPNFTVKVDPPKVAKVGTQATVAVGVTPRSGYKMNLRYPTKLLVTPPPGVTLPKTKLTKADGQISEKQARFSLAFTPTAPGKKVFTAVFKFSVCTAKHCEINKEKLSWTVQAE